MSVTVLLPSIGREKQLMRLVKHLQPTMVKGSELLVILDATHNFPTQDFPWVNFHITETRGCWRCMNEALDIAQYRRFISLDDDTWPGAHWLEHAIICFDRSFPDGLGLVAMRDGITNHGGADFPLTTIDWLYVIFGDYRFPGHFDHLYLDTLLADRSKSLGKYFFCAASVVEHRHWKVGKADKDAIYRHEHLVGGTDDKKKKDILDVEWVEGGREEALRRLNELNSRRT